MKEEGGSADSGPKILLAEDLAINRKVALASLRKLQAQVEVVDNGQDAFDKALEAESQGAPFDVILMDMFMPVLDGLVATRMLRERGYTRPIVAVTASVELEACLEAGCDDFLEKPYLPDKLREKVAAHTRPLQE